QPADKGLGREAFGAVPPPVRTKRIREAVIVQFRRAQKIVARMHHRFLKLSSFAADHRFLSKSGRAGRADTVDRARSAHAARRPSIYMPVPTERRQGHASTPT